MTVILNLAATVGLSIAALFGTNERLIGENSYFAGKNNILYARAEKLEKAENNSATVPLFSAIAFKFKKDSVQDTSRIIDDLLRDATQINIETNGSMYVSVR